MNDILDIPGSFLSELLNLGPEMLMILFVLAFGYALKRMDFVPNKRIPLILLAAVCIFYPIMAEHGPIPSEVALTKGPRIKAFVRNEIIAVVLWMIAWMIHAKAISKLEDKFEWIGGSKKKSASDGQTPT